MLLFLTDDPEVGLLEWVVQRMRECTWEHRKVVSTVCIFEFGVAHSS